MTIYVTIRIRRGAIEAVTAYLTRESAETEERHWRQRESTRNATSRANASNRRTTIILRECPLKP
jgi:hypothetical protein